jgi:purine-binding chemotaxis protein CheW
VSALLKEESMFQEDTQRGKYLTFTLGNEHYGLEIKHVTEIIGIQEITMVPELPEYIKGIINLRGQIIPVMDVRLRFRKPFREYNDRTCVIVVDIKSVSVGLIVDAVSEVLSIQDEEVVPPPDVTRGFSNRYIKGIGKVGNEVKLILDCNKLLNDEETENLGNLPS